MSHVVLLGDSILDNVRYVAPGLSVADQLRRRLGTGCRVTLLARDGSGVAEMPRQIEQVPEDATHVIVSVGGNDALDRCATVLHEKAESFAQVLAWLAGVHASFQRDYRDMLDRILTKGKPTAVCTIYDRVPILERAEATALCIFNDVIVREAFRARLPVLDLRLLCTEPNDYSDLSPIEPSAAGGAKIAAAIARLLTDR